MQERSEGEQSERERRDITGLADDFDESRPGGLRSTPEEGKLSHATNFSFGFYFSD